MKSDTDLASRVHRFRALFAGLDRAYGTYRLTGQVTEGGKREGVATTERGPVTQNLWEAHLSGTQGLGIIPIQDGDTCTFGAIDVDIYCTLDHGAVAATVAQRGWPLVTCCSKSGGLHLFLFTAQPETAGRVQLQSADAQHCLK